MSKKDFNNPAANDSLSPDQVKKITDHLLIEQTELYPADLGFVFGSYAFCDPLVQKAADLYHQGYFPQIIVCGAPLNIQGEVEATYIKNKLIKKGVPADNILTEERSTNTQENIEFAKEIIEQEIGLDNVKSIIGIGQLYAARRYMMTIKRRWSEVFNMHASVNGFDCARHDWPHHPDFRRHVLKEWQKLQDYPAKDFIREVDIDDTNKTVQRWRSQDKKQDNKKGYRPT